MKTDEIFISNIHIDHVGNFISIRDNQGQFYLMQDLAFIEDPSIFSALPGDKLHILYKTTTKETSLDGKRCLFNLNKIHKFVLISSKEDNLYAFCSGNYQKIDGLLKSTCQTFNRILENIGIPNEKADYSSGAEVIDVIKSIRKRIEHISELPTSKEMGESLTLSMRSFKKSLNLFQRSIDKDVLCTDESIRPNSLSDAREALLTAIEHLNNEEDLRSKKASQNNPREKKISSTP